jgi:hypothetical protein
MGVIACLLILFPSVAIASPSPAQTGIQLPQPDPAFKGKISETYQNSTPNWTGFTVDFLQIPLGFSVAKESPLFTLKSC